VAVSTTPTPRTKPVHPLLSHTSTTSALITLCLVSNSLLLHHRAPLPRPLTAPVKRRAEGGAPPAKRLRGASSVCHLTTSTRDQGASMVAHQAPSTVLPLASMVAHQALPCTSTTVSMVAHLVVETFTRSSSLLQLCTMQHQDTFSMVAHSTTSHSSSTCSTANVLPRALTALLLLLSSLFSLHHSTTASSSSRKRKAEEQEHRMAKMARHLPPPPLPRQVVSKQLLQDLLHTIEKIMGHSKEHTKEHIVEHEECEKEQTTLVLAEDSHLCTSLLAHQATSSTSPTSPLAHLTASCPGLTTTPLAHLTTSSPGLATSPLAHLTTSCPSPSTSPLAHLTTPSPGLATSPLAHLAHLTTSSPSLSTSLLDHQTTSTNNLSTSLLAHQTTSTNNLSTSLLAHQTTINNNFSTSLLAHQATSSPGLSTSPLARVMKRKAVQQMGPPPKRLKLSPMVTSRPLLMVTYNWPLALLPPATSLPSSPTLSLTPLGRQLLLLSTLTSTHRPTPHLSPLALALLPSPRKRPAEEVKVPEVKRLRLTHEVKVLEVKRLAQDVKVPEVKKLRLTQEVKRQRLADEVKVPELKRPRLAHAAPTFLHLAASLGSRLARVRQELAGRQEARRTRIQGVQRRRSQVEEEVEQVSKQIIAVFKRKRIEDEEEEGAPKAKVSRALWPARALHCGSPGLCTVTTVTARTFPTNLHHLLEEEEEEEEEEVQFRDASMASKSLCLASPSHRPCTSPSFTSRAGRPAPAVLGLLLQGEEEGLGEEGHEEQKITLHYFV